MRPRTQRQPLDVTSFIGGIITEASPLNFPLGASLDEENFVLNRDGTRARRLGLEVESSATYNAISTGSLTLSGVALSSFLWENVGEIPERAVWVQQVGNVLHIYGANVFAPSKHRQQEITLTATNNIVFSFAGINGDLVVAAGDQELRAIRRIGTDSYSLIFSRIKVRDFWGVDDNLDISERTASLGPLHAYNLYNQGWPPEFFCSADPENPSTMNTGSTEDPVSRTRTSLGKYPSNSDVMYSALTFLTNGRKAYYPHALSNILNGNTPAASGHYIIDLFNRSQGRIDTYQADQDAGWTARVDYTSSIPTDQSTGGIKAVAAYAGRVFYACSSGETGGDNRSPHVGTFVLFSKLVDSHADLGKCYQEADPTAEDISDLIDTDGGYIQLPTVSDIKALIPYKDALLVFADNGVWQIRGGDRGFTATEYQSVFLTPNGVLSAQSIVVTADAVLYWSRNGIFVISESATGTAIVSLTQDSIQTYYNSIPYESKLKAVGYYDDSEYRIRWLYQEEYEDTCHFYTHELILDFLNTEKPAWSKFAFYTVASRPLRVMGYIRVPGISRTLQGYDFKYATMRRTNTQIYQVTASVLSDEHFRDWYSADASGTDAAAFLVTGFFTGGDSARKKFAPYLTTHFNRTETRYVDEGSGTMTISGASSCIGQAQWEWCTTADSGRWSEEFQAYRNRHNYMVSEDGTLSYGYSVITTRNKIRGNGRALSLKFRTEPYMDLQLLGWNIELGINQEP